MAQKSKSSPSRLTGETELTRFDKLTSLKQDLVCITFLLVLIFTLFHDIIFKNMVFSTAGDTAAAQSWAKAIEHIKNAEHTSPLWIPYIFSGMPIAGALLFPDEVNYLEVLLQLPSRILFLGAELHWFMLHYFLMGVSLYLLARRLKFSPLPSLLGALTLMLNPYAIGLAQAGHGSKLITLSYIPLLFLLVHNLFERRNVLSLGLLSATIGTLLLNRHPQIAFYGLLLIGCYLLYELIVSRQQSRIAAVKFMLFIVAVGIGFSMYFYEFLPTQEYAQYSIRGGGEAGAAGGLNYDYATNWSFHPFETIGYMIPSFFGVELGMPSQTYWGWMPFTDTTVYIGIVPLLFGILALVYVRNRETLFLALFSLLILLISFGKHLPIMYDLLFNYVPYFNKFRAPSMILHLMPITFGVLAAYGFTALTDLRNKLKEPDIVKLRKRFTLTAGIIGAILAIGFIGNNALYEFTSGFMFEKEGDLQQLRQAYGPQAQQALGQLQHMRFDLLWKDYIKFALISGVSIGLIILYLKRNLKSTTLGFGLLAVLAIDLIIINTKFINPQPRTDFEKTFAPDATVRFLKSDASLYRIFPLGGLFQDNSWMYHTIQSIGGYSPAKLKIYQEMIDSCLYHGWDPNFPLNMNIVNMLNIKYLVAQGRLPEDRFAVVAFDQIKNIVTHQNRTFMPRAWFVEDVIVAGSKHVVFQHLNSPIFNPRTTAVLEKSPSMQPTKSDSTAVQMTSFGPHMIVLNTFCSNPSLLVLSEIYYPAGWKAYVDGAETEIYKTNYILRSIIVPSGTHTVEFVFDPPVYKQGLLITHIGWGITALLILVGLYQHPSVRTRLFKKEKAQETKQLDGV